VTTRLGMSDKYHRDGERFAAISYQRGGNELVFSSFGNTISLPLLWFGPMSGLKVRSLPS